MSENNPINYDDLFDFGDKAQITKGLAGIAALQKAYEEFYDVVGKGQLQRLSEQEKDLAKVQKELANSTKALSIAEQAHQEKLLANLKAAEQLRAAQEKLRKEKEAAAKTNNTLKNSVETLSQQYARLKKEYDAAFQKNNVAEMKRIATEAKNVDKQMKEMAAALRSVKPAFTAAVGSYDALDAATKKLVRDLKSLPGGMSNTSAAAMAMKKQIYENTQQLKDFDAEMNHNFRNVGNYRSAVNGLADDLRSLALSYISLSAVMAAITATFNQALISDAIRTSLEFTFGSVDLADVKLEMLGDRAKQLGVDYNALAASYKSFIGAVMASNYNLEDGERIFDAVAGASARLKLSSEQTERALTALQQMISKGTVSSEELRQQLGEALPGAFSLAAQAMGVTEFELGKMLERGEVMASEMLPKLAGKLEEVFDTKNTDKVKGMNAEWNNLWNTFKIGISESTNLNAVFERVIGRVNALASSIVGLVNSKSWDEFWVRMWAGGQKKGDLIAGIGNTFDRAQKAINNSSEVDLATADTKKIRMTYEEVRVSYQAARTELEKYKKAVADGTLIDKGKVTIKSLSQTVDVLYGKMQQINKFIPKVATGTTKDLRTDKQIEAARKKEEAAQRKADNAAIKSAKDALKATEDIIKANNKLRLSEAEVELANSDGGYEAKKAFEDKKIKLLNEAYDARLGLYNKDSAQYKEILAEKLSDDADYTLKVRKLAEDEAKAQVKAAEDQAKALRIIKEGEAKVAGAAAGKMVSEQTGQIQLDVASRKLTPEEGNDALFALRQAALKAEVEARKQALSEIQGSEKDQYDAQVELINAEKALIDDRYDYEVNKAQEAANKRAEIQQQVTQLVGDLTQAGFDLFGSFSDARIQRLEQEKEYELSLAGNNEAAKAKIEANYQKKIAAEKRKGAIADKAAAVIGIAINTAQAVMKVTAQTGILAPFVIPGIIALGAIQAAIVAAKPIPKFAKGTDNAPGGLSIVGEKGTEAIEHKGKVAFTGSKAHYTYLPKGAKVLTAEKTKEKYNYENIQDRQHGDAVINSLLQGTGVVAAQATSKQTEIMAQMLSKSLTPDQVQEAMTKAIENLTIQQLFIDERGHNTYLRRKNQKINDQNSRNTFGGQG